MNHLGKSHKGPGLTSRAVQLGVVELLDQRVDHLDRPVHLEVSSAARSATGSETNLLRLDIRTYPTKNFLAAILDVCCVNATGDDDMGV